MSSHLGKGESASAAERNGDYSEISGMALRT